MLYDIFSYNGELMTLYHCMGGNWELIIPLVGLGLGISWRYFQYAYMHERTFNEMLNMVNGDKSKLPEKAIINRKIALVFGFCGITSYAIWIFAIVLPIYIPMIAFMIPLLHQSTQLVKMTKNHKSWMDEQMGMNELKNKLKKLK